jgi:lysophospholipase L1-like esterase
MGDSITEFWTPNFWNESRVNRGISGQTTPQMLLRFRSDVLELKPKVVVILAGTNDVAENTGPARIEMIIGNIVSMVELAQTNGLKVVLGSILPAAEFPWNKALKPAEKIMAINRNLRAYSMQKQLTFVDYFSEMVDDKNGLRLEYSEDGVHPNKAGYDVMERLVAQALAVHLKAEQ